MSQTLNEMQQTGRKQRRIAVEKKSHLVSLLSLDFVDENQKNRTREAKLN